MSRLNRASVGPSLPACLGRKQALHEARKVVVRLAAKPSGVAHVDRPDFEHDAEQGLHVGEAQGIPLCVGAHQPRHKRHSRVQYGVLLPEQGN